MRKVAANPSVLSGIEPILLMSHLACADEPAHPLNALQLARFRELRALFPTSRPASPRPRAYFSGA